MKKLLFLLLPLLGVIACKPGESSFYYQNLYAFGTVVSGGQLYVESSGMTIKVTEDLTDGKWMQEQAVFFLCDLTGFAENGSYQASLKSYEPVTRKAALVKSDSDPDVYGNSPVDLQYVWGGNSQKRYIDISCLATSLKNSETVHTIDLVLDDVRSNADTLYLEIHHQGFGESYENEAYGISDFQIDTHYLRFDLSNLIPSSAGPSIVLHFDWDWFEVSNNTLQRDKPKHFEDAGIFTLTE